MIRNVFKQTVDDKGLSVSEVCRITGLHRSNVGRLYRGETNRIDFETIDKLCNGLNIQITDIMQVIPNDEMTIDDIIQLEKKGKLKKT